MSIRGNPAEWGSFRRPGWLGRANLSILDEVRLLLSVQDERLPGASLSRSKDKHMNNIIYIVGLVVVVIAVLSFFGFR